jgi:hypothetical protein
MAKVHRDAAKFQADVSSNFQLALRKFEGLILAENSKRMPASAPHEGKPPMKTQTVLATPTPAISEPNVLNLVITVPDDEAAPTTSRLRAAATVQPTQASLKGKEWESPLAYIEMVSTSEAVASDDSDDDADVKSEDSVLERQLALYSADERPTKKPLASSLRNPTTLAVVCAQKTLLRPAAPPTPAAKQLIQAHASLKQWILE